MIRVLVNGALGRMGSEVCKKVYSEADLELVGAVDIKEGTVPLGDGVKVTTDLVAAIEAAKYFPHVEIIEKHHDNKLDAPSGTAIITAQKIAEVRKAMHQGNPDEKETMAGARGADYEGMKIHSVRLPGYVASQEVIFGGQGETLKISTDPINRECYMPGVALGCRKIVDQVGLVYGLDKLL